MPMAHIDRNALVRDGKDARSGIQAEWFDPEKIGKGQPIMWVRGQTFPGKVRQRS